MGSNRTPITSQTRTPRGGIPTKFRPTSTSGHTDGSYQSRKIFNGFIFNNIITFTIDESTWVKISKNAAISIIQTIFWPLQSPEPLKRGKIFFLADYQEKVSSKNAIHVWVGTPTLACYKYYSSKTASVQDIRVYLSMESSTGKINHVVHITPLARYFVTTLRNLLKW